MAIHEVNQEEGDEPVYVISSGCVWLPGAYKSRRAAGYAFQFSCEELQRLQDSVNPGGVITLLMLKNLRRKNKEKNEDNNNHTDCTG